MLCYDMNVITQSHKPTEDILIGKFAIVVPVVVKVYYIVSHNELLLTYQYSNIYQHILKVRIKYILLWLNIFWPITSLQ